MSISCGNCLFQGDRSADEKGNATVFCMANARWFGEEKKCELFREYADISKDVRIRIAAEIRQEEYENRRLNKIVKSNIKLIIFTVMISFVFFWLTVKIFDKYIF